MESPRIAHREGFYYEVKAGQRYFWCSCGRSANQPFCDGSHAGTRFTPLMFEAKADEEVVFCGCKHTGTPPFCNGAHNNLPGATSPDDPYSAANRAVIEVAHAEEPKVPLDGASYVFSTRRATLTRHGTMAYCPVITPAEGASFQSQFYAEFAQGVSPVLGANGGQFVLFVSEGRGEADISGRRFSFGPGTGLSVRAQEAFRIRNTAPDVVRLFISSAPAVEELTFLDELPDNFDENYPARTVATDPSQRHAMAERYFQILVNREHGSAALTQFIGNIPLSKAKPHRHLYEEALIFLRGTGVVWTERKKTTVAAGDVLFLPRKLSHSVQCTADTGLDVVGVICPGNNPSISY